MTKMKMIKSSLCIFAASLLVLTGCSNSLFPDDQKSACEDFFNVVNDLQSLTKIDQCEQFCQSLNTIPDKTFDRLEKTMLNCQFGFMSKNALSANIKSKMFNAANVIEILLNPPCPDSYNNPSLPKLAARMENIKLHYLEKQTKVRELQNTPEYQNNITKQGFSEICRFYSDLDKTLKQHKDDCNLAAADFERFLDSDLIYFEQALSSVPNLFEPGDNMTKYQKCFAQIAYDNSPYMKCVKEGNINFIQTNARMMAKSMDMQRAGLMKKAQQAMDDNSYDPLILNHTVKTNPKFEPWISQICAFFDELASTLEKHKDNCQEMAQAHKQYLDDHLDDFNNLLDQHQDLFHTNDGMTQWARCNELLQHYNSPYMNCITGPDHNDLLVQHARMYQHYSEIYSKTTTNRLNDAGDTAIYTTEKTILTGFAQIASSPLPCPEIEDQLIAWLQTVDHLLDFLGNKNIPQKLNSGRLADERIQLIQNTFGKNAPVQRCIQLDGVKSTYNRVVNALKLNQYLDQ